MLKIDDIHYPQQIKFYYKYLNNLLPSYFTLFNSATNATAIPHEDVTKYEIAQSNMIFHVNVSDIVYRF